MVVEYGEEPEAQPGLFDGVTLTDELVRANREERARIVDKECVKALEDSEAISEIAFPDYPAGGTPWL